MRAAVTDNMPAELVNANRECTTGPRPHTERALCTRYRAGHGRLNRERLDLHHGRGLVGQQNAVKERQAGVTREERMESQQSADQTDRGLTRGRRTPEMGNRAQRRW